MCHRDRVGSRESHVEKVCVLIQGRERGKTKKIELPFYNEKSNQVIDKKSRTSRASIYLYIYTHT